MLSNYEKWKSYTKHSAAPDNFLDFGFYSLIASALQRRVWVGPSHKKLFLNNYTILVAPPGIGKGLTIKPLAEILKYHKMPDPANNGYLDKIEDKIDRKVAESAAKDDYRLAQEQEAGYETGKSSEEKTFEKPLLIPMAADATTYEALVTNMSRSIRRINYYDVDENGQKTMRIYTHCSLNFNLEEISSLLRKHTQDTVNFLLQAYDSGDYTYDTKTKGKHRIRAGCLNILAGTTPDFLQEVFDDRLLGQGFSSRCWFIWATENRDRPIFEPDLTEEQQQHYKDLLAHVKKLTELYGRVELTKEALEFIEDWWKENKNKPVNKSPKMQAYYSRNQLHTIKLAGAIHFGETTDMVMGIEPLKRAIEIKAKEELNMHYALGLDKDNPLAKPAAKIVKYVAANGAQSRNDLLIEFFGAIPNGVEGLDSILEYLTKSGELVPDNTNGSMVYKIRPKVEEKK